MLKLVGDNDDELAAVIGHEVAHAIARHSAERASQALAGQVGVTALGVGVAATTESSGAAAVAATAGTALAQLGVLLPYSRLQESESDHIGVILSARAGFDPRAAISLWRKMGESSKGQNPPAMLSTHPLNEQRIRDLEKVMPEALQYYQKR